MRSSILFLVTLCVLPSPAAAQDPIPVLLVSGANNHDWEWTTPSIASMLEESGRFEVTVTYDPATDLAASLEGYEAIVLDYNGPRWGEAAEENFLAAVEGGTGVTVIHAADNAFPGWVEYETLVALLWRRAGDVATGHGKFHPFDVTVVDRDHPITRTLPTLRQHPDELYHRLIHMHEAPFRVLATAYSDPETGGTGQDEPMIAVQEYGAGRIFHTPLGHVWRDVEASRVSHADPQFRALIVNGTEWAATGRVTDGQAAPNHLSELERVAGWRSLFDGETLAGWRAYGGEAAPEGWTVTSGCLHRTSHAGDLVTEEEFEDFELRFEWKIARGTNSGVKVRVQEREDRPAPIGLEYQLLDDAAFPDLPRNQCTGALYDLITPGEKHLAPLTTFNRSRIVVRGSRVEYWLNGQRVVDVDMTSDTWKEHVAASKFAKVEGFGTGPGRIVLQDHGDEVWFRSIAIRPLLPRSTAKSLLPKKDLQGWREVGDAVYRREGDAILGEVGGGGQSFLVSEATYGDFVLEVDLRLEDMGNSGIQIRSHQRENGRVYGYQIEIDPSDRAWSAGLFDEARRGWLDDHSDNPAARAAFRKDDWNTYRIQCIGPWIKTWVNGVPAADHFDPLDLEGFLALQVHSGNNTKLRWRNPVVWDLGTRAWEPIEEFILEGGWTGDGTTLRAESAGSLAMPSLSGDFAMRARVTAAEGLQLIWRAERGFAPEAARPITDGLRVDGTGWALSIANLPGVETGQDIDLAVACYGARVAIHVNGALVLDREVHGASLEGMGMLNTSGAAPVQLSGLVQVGAAR